MGAVEYLLDTHALLWAAQEKRKLGNNAQNVLNDESTAIYVSAMSAYEITNKYRIGKLPGYEYVVENYADILVKLGVVELPLNTQHAHYAGKFEWDHRDPFERMLAAQAFIR